MADQNADSDLQRLERDAEQARARLQVTIAEIKDPQTIANAKSEVTTEVMKLKDQVVDYIRGAKDDALGQMQDARQRQTSEFSRKLQRTAVENPIPVLLIGAGIGWHLYKKPPVTTALLAAGVYGLMKNWNGSADERRWRDPYGRDASGYVPGGVAGYGYDGVKDVAGVADRLKNAATHASYKAEDAVSGARASLADARHSAEHLAADVSNRMKGAAAHAAGAAQTAATDARHSLSDAKSAGVEMAGGLKESLYEAKDNLVDQLTGAYAAGADRVQDLAKTAAARVQPALDRVQPAVDAVRPAVDRVKPLFDENHRGQLGMLLVLAGAGAVAGSFLRSTDTGRRWTEQARESLQENWHHLRERASDIHPSDWREQAAELPGRVSETARATASRMSDAALHLRDSASQRTLALRERGADVSRTARDASSDHPLLLSALGLAVGAVLGGMIRQTAGERAALGETAAALRDGAAEVVRETMHDVSARVSGAAEGVMEATGLKDAKNKDKPAGTGADALRGSRVSA